MSGFYVPNLDEVHEPEPVEDGFYDVEIANAKLIIGDKGERISIQISILNPPDGTPRPPDIFHTLFPPREDQEDWQIQNSRLQLKRFFTLFGIPAPDHEMDQDETDEWLRSWRGLRAKCKVRKVFNERMERDENQLSVPPVAKGRGNSSAQKSSGAIQTI